jgi:hypothetical protein
LRTPAAPAGQRCAAQAQHLRARRQPRLRVRLLLLRLLQLLLLLLLLLLPLLHLLLHLRPLLLGLDRAVVQQKPGQLAPALRAALRRRGRRREGVKGARQRPGHGAIALRKNSK